MEKYIEYSKPKVSQAAFFVNECQCFFTCDLQVIVSSDLEAVCLCPHLLNVDVCVTAGRTREEERTHTLLQTCQDYKAQDSTYGDLLCLLF